MCLLAVRALRPQVCHDLELFRCYASEADRKRMDRKLACLAVEIGKDATEELKGFALDALSQTGDRILYAPMKGKKKHEVALQSHLNMRWERRRSGRDGCRGAGHCHRW